jgi:hypothetical protein
LVSKPCLATVAGRWWRDVERLIGEAIIAVLRERGEAVPQPQTLVSVVDVE